MPRCRSVMRRRRGRVLVSNRPQEFEVEDVSAELLRESAIDSTSQTDVSSLLPVRATTPKVNSPSLDAVSLPLVKPPEICYLPLEIAADLISRFDGESSSLLPFIKQCRRVDSRVKPSDRGNLLLLIRYRIEGPANLLLANGSEPTTLDELVGLLKQKYARLFDFHEVYDELRGLRQETDEPVQFYGARACEILSRGLEGAKGKFNSEQLIGVAALLNEAAVIYFRRGLQNQNLRFVLLIDEQDKTLDSTINVASRLDQVTNKSSEIFPSPAVLRDVEVVTTDTGSFKCFNCNQEGHYRNNCSWLERNLRNPPGPQRLRCRYCRKTGHTESRCFRKRNRYNTGMRREASVP